MTVFLYIVFGILLFAIILIGFKIFGFDEPDDAVIVPLGLACLAGWPLLLFMCTILIPVYGFYKVSKLFVHFLYNTDFDEFFNKLESPPKK